MKKLTCHQTAQSSGSFDNFKT